MSWQEVRQEMQLVLGNPYARNTDPWSKGQNQSMHILTQVMSTWNSPPGFCPIPPRHGSLPPEQRPQTELHPSLYWSIVSSLTTMLKWHPVWPHPDTWVAGEEAELFILRRGWHWDRESKAEACTGCWEAWGSQTQWLLCRGGFEMHDHFFLLSETSLLAYMDCTLHVLNFILKPSSYRCKYTIQKRSQCATCLFH